MNSIKIFFAAALLLAGAACKTQKDVFVEPQKDLAGTWRISKITRNAADITEWVDSTGFRLVLNNDNSYTLGENKLPFLVGVAGSWMADDPQYPYQLSFVPANAQDSITGSITTPVIKGSRSLNITFSPGCNKNTYVYTLEKMQ